MRKQIVKLNESQLKRIIKESVTKIVNEMHTSKQRSRAEKLFENSTSIIYANTPCRVAIIKSGDEIVVSTPKKYGMNKSTFLLNSCKWDYETPKFTSEMFDGDKREAEKAAIMLTNVIKYECGYSGERDMTDFGWPNRFEYYSNKDTYIG